MKELLSVLLALQILNLTVINTVHAQEVGQDDQEQEVIDLDEVDARIAQDEAKSKDDEMFKGLSEEERGLFTGHIPVAPTLRKVQPEEAQEESKVDESSEEKEEDSKTEIAQDSKQDEEEKPKDPVAQQPQVVKDEEKKPQPQEEAEGQKEEQDEEQQQAQSPKIEILPVHHLLNGQIHTAQGNSLAFSREETGANPREVGLYRALRNQNECINKALSRLENFLDKNLPELEMRLKSRVPMSVDSVINAHFESKISDARPIPDLSQLGTKFIEITLSLRPQNQLMAVADLSFTLSIPGGVCLNVAPNLEELLQNQVDKIAETFQTLIVDTGHAAHGDVQSGDEAKVADTARSDASSPRSPSSMDDDSSTSRKPAIVK